MNRIFLHIGHIKTGSSALQNFFVNNLEILSKHSIIYPVSKQLEQAAAHNKISSGNGANIVARLKMLSVPVNGDILFSSELIFSELLSDGYFNEVCYQAERLNSKLILVCYTRDFFSFSFSAWGQYIKRSRGTLDYIDYMNPEATREYKNRFDIYQKIKKIIETTSENNIELRIFNYDRHKDNLPHHFLKNGLGFDISADTLKISKLPTNRSLTLAEYELQRLFNVYYSGNSSEFISDPLVEMLPMVKPENPHLTNGQYRKILNKYKEEIDVVNEYLPAPERICVESYDELLDRCPPKPQKAFDYSLEQLKVFVESIVSKLNKNNSYSNVSLKKLIEIRLKQKAGRLLGKK